MPLTELRELARATPWECVNYDEASHTCEAIARTTWRDDRHGTSRLALLAQRSPRVVVALSAPTWAEGDLECGRTADATVEVEVDRSLPEDAADRAEAVIRRALAGERAVTCAGVVRDGEHFRVVGYRDGRPTGSSTALRLFAEPPALRPRDGEA